MVVNLVSDTKGRRTAVLLDLTVAVVGSMCNCLIMIGALIGGNNHNVYFLMLAQFLLGFGAYSLLTLGYTILADFFSDHLRHIGIVVISAMA
jgi:MFS family permease